ncbi:adenylyltransferase/cytidyltransferase family protein [Anaerocolumna jejuensis]|uniref:adenylyltransferase/cytidyltransferase family protein n=1 Tax=Anaerocolumna jejuensis TaxID=259063 RepID=UPI003F7CC176
MKIKNDNLQERIHKNVKKYNIGYIAGVYDLFHIGHLNVIKRAKEKCNYLIVGVLVDELVVHFKKKTPFIPFEERIEIIRSIKGVDEAVPVTSEILGKMDSWRAYHYDCQFSGSDYANAPDWLADKAALEEVGATIEFFPYTETTSSTYIKKLVEKEIIGRKMFLFGAGEIGRRFLRFIQDSDAGIGWNVIGFVDNNIEKSMSLLEKKIIYQPEYLTSYPDYKNITVVVTTKVLDEIVEQLTHMGIKNIIPYYEFSGYDDYYRK